jgi:hypothetical protein
VALPLTEWVVARGCHPHPHRKWRGVWAPRVPPPPPPPHHHRHHTTTATVRFNCRPAAAAAVDLGVR